MKVAAFDLKDQYAELRDELLPVLEHVLERGEFILGENVERLEEEIAAYTGAAYGVGVANGSDALNLALMAYRVGPGDEVIVPAFTFFATAGAVARVGATPVFVDVDPRTFNIDVTQIEAAITPKTRAIIPVHLYGQAAPMEEIMLIAQRHGLRVIEDAAQAIGAVRAGRPVCSFGDAGCLSFYPTKNLGAYGDGGMVVTNDPEVAEKLRVLRMHGSRVKYHHEILGYNSRLDEMQAAILRVKLRHLSRWNSLRVQHAKYYDSLFAQADFREFVTSPFVAEANTHTYHQYTVRAQRRDNLKDYLAKAGVATAIYYPLSLHLQKVFQTLSVPRESQPISERLNTEVLSLPMYPELRQEAQEYVVSQISRFYI